MRQLSCKVLNLWCGSPETVVSKNLSACNLLLLQDARLSTGGRTGTRLTGDSPGQREPQCQLMASLTGLPTRLSISTSVSIVNLAVFLFTTSETRGRETSRISAASDCFR